MSESGRAMQVVDVTEEHAFRLDEAALREVLMADEIRDLPVAVVSLAGAHRGGKSFMLNFFLRYLTSPESARKDGSWVGSDEEVLTGFSWRGGSRRNTTGILLWSKPLITTLPNGDKVAVLLMDTQGTFDNTSTVRDCSTIFALSTLISSVQIYNLPGGSIQEDDLQHLQLFTEYGKLVSEGQEGKKAFQVLEFLVRDWGNEYEYPFGNEGGQHYLDAVVMEVTPRTPQELKELRAQLLASFETVTCFLMPHPGLNVRKLQFKGFISDMESNFVANLHTLASSIFSADKLKVKLINGRPTKAGELFTYFKTYMDVFNSDTIPTPTSILEATTEAGLLLAMRAAIEQYEAAMDAACGTNVPAIPAAMVKIAHQRKLRAALATFMETKKLASQKQADEFLSKLTSDIDKREYKFMSINLAKTLRVERDANDLYDKTLLDITGDKPLCVHAEEVRDIHEEAVTAAIELYDCKRMGMPEKDDERDAFIKSFEQTKKLEILKQQNETNNNLAISDIYNEYLESTKDSATVSMREFSANHDTALARALEQFEKRRTRHSKYPADVYKTTLINKIKEANDRNHHLNNIATTVEEAVNLYKSMMKERIDSCKLWLPMSYQRQHAFLASNHIKCKKAALEWLNSNWVDLHRVGLRADVDDTVEKMIKDAYEVYQLELN